MKCGDIPFQPDGLADQLDADFDAIGLRRELADHVKAVDMTGIGRQDRGIELLGFGQPPGPVMVERVLIKLGVVDPDFQRGNPGFENPRAAALSRTARASPTAPVSSNASAKESQCWLCCGSACNAAVRNESAD